MLRRLDRRRLVVLAVLLAALLGFVAGWLARVWSTPTPEERAHDAVEDLRDRARQLTK
jgi:uncharacterized membrane protein YccC